jgi:Cd2+/Zn2+-exporting ATPase
MNKLQIEIPLILPEVPDEKDACVHRLIDTLQDTEGVEKVHVKETPGNAVPALCFHYDPEVISIDRVRSLALQAGAAISKKIGHKLIEVDGIRQPRHARYIEQRLREISGIMEASVSATGMVRVEFDSEKTGEKKILEVLGDLGLDIISAKVDPGRYLKKTAQGRKHEHKHDHVHDDHHGHDHEHHPGAFGKNSELIFSISSGALLVIGFSLSKVDGVSTWVTLALYIGAYFLGGYYTAKEAFETVIKGGFEIDFLMLVAAIGAAILGEWAEGALLLFLFSMGHALEHYAMNKARKSIAALADLAPKTALLKRDGRTTEVGIGQLNIGDIIVVRPNSRISADGIVISGNSGVDQAPITGESIPVDKKAGDTVYSGTINGNGTLDIRVTRQAEDSTLARLVMLVNEAQTQKSPTQRFTDKFERYFVPSVLGLVVVLNFAFLVIDETFSESFYRAMAVLVAASPCALAISTPSAVLSGVARAAKMGVLIKGGRPLEDLGVLTAVAFDKTGTLTEGKPKLTEIISLGDTKPYELLKIVVSVESLSDHPLAKAIARDGKDRLKGQEVPEARDLEAVPGKGIKATLENDKVYIGNLELFESLDEKKPGTDLRAKVLSLESRGNTTMVIRRNETYIGIIALMDTPRQEAKTTLQQLKEIGIKRMIMLTGDNQKVADVVANEIGITDAWGGLLPEGKVKAIKELREEESKVAMVGDGVNDAPAMAHSTVGIAMGAVSSDVALETADVALMADNLGRLPFAIGLSRQAKRIIRQNLFISLGMVVILIPLTISGVATIGPAVLLHEGSTLVVVMNALRLLAYKEVNSE